MMQVKHLIMIYLNKHKIVDLLRTSSWELNSKTKLLSISFYVYVSV